MAETWRGFGADMSAAVREALDKGRSPAERAYGVGVIVHNYFGARGVMLTSSELRALAGELVGPRLVPAVDEPAVAEDAPPSIAEPRVELVSFVGKEEPTERAWAGDQRIAPPPEVADSVFAAPSQLVNVVDREAASFDRLVFKVVEAARPRLTGAAADRGRARVTIDAAIDEISRNEDATPSAEMRQRLSRAAMSEIHGLGLLDRLWADRSIRAVYVNGPEQVQVERNGMREPVSEKFRDAAHLLDIARRLARPGSTGIVEFQMRDGGNGIVVFPPAAPSGPVLVLQRGEPGNATLERLVASRMLDRRIAALLAIAARARLNIAVLGPQGSGKTALLAAIARDLSAVRVVTVAAHRQFRWPSATKVELVVPPSGPSFGSLVTAGARLQPDVLVVDALPPGDVPALVTRLSRGARGLLVALRTDAMAVVLARSADLVVRLGQSSDGRVRVLAVEDATGASVFVHDGGGFHRLTMSPAFAGIVQEAGYGEALAGIFH